jgi:ribosomal protein S18 acetylase RimI-like enzyme
MGWEIRRFDALTALREDWEAYREYLAHRYRETDRGDPVPSADLLARAFSSDHGAAETRVWQAEQDGEIVGRCRLVMPRPDAAVWMRAGVRRVARRRGIGTAWLARARDAMEEHGAESLTARETEEDGQGFLRKAGFTETGREEEHRLDLPAVDDGRLGRWIEDLPDRLSGALIETWADGVPESARAEYAAALSDIVASEAAPSLSPGDLRRRSESVAEAGGRNPACAVRDGEGRIVGVADAYWMPHLPTSARHGYTGVRESHRGAGVGKALKAALLRHLREEYEGIRTVRTGGTRTNPAIRALNDRIGYRHHHTTVDYRIGREALAGFLDYSGSS